MVDARNVTSGCTFRLITPSSGAVPAIHHGWNRVFPMHFLNNFALGHQPCCVVLTLASTIVAHWCCLYCVINCFQIFFSFLSEATIVGSLFYLVDLSYCSELRKLQKGLNLPAKNVVNQDKKKNRIIIRQRVFHSLWKSP